MGGREIKPRGFAIRKADRKVCGTAGKHARATPSGIRPGLPRLGCRRRVVSSSRKLFALALLCLALPEWAGAQQVILHLKNGDRLAGTIVSQDTNRVVITTSWIKELAIPANQIAGREPLAAGAGRVAAIPGAGGTNALASRLRLGPLIVAGISPAPTNAPTKRLSGELRIGAAFLYGVNHQQIYSGRMKLTYEQPYASNPKEYFRNFLDFSLDYGRLSVSNQTAVLSADRLDATDKVTADIGRRFYVYNLVSAGYDTVREIGFRDEIGPGLGYHVVMETNLTANAEAGMDYQGQYLTDPAQTAQRYVYYRLAEDLNWKLSAHLTLIEKYEFFPQIDSPQYHSRFETTLSYLLWKNLTFNLTAQDVYESKPAQGVAQNDLQVRSSLGFKF